MNTTTSFQVPPGKPVAINNPNPYSVKYRVEFANGDSVAFTVLPGGHFTVNTNSSNINLHIEEMIPTGINPV